MKLSNHLFILIAFLLLLSNCHIEVLPWKYIPHQVTDSQNNFLRMYLPQNFEDGEQKLNIDAYMISFLLEEKDSVMKRFVLINPDKNLNIAELRWGVDQFKFQAGCELAFPIPNGKNRYEIKLGRFFGGFIVDQIFDVELQPNQSLRVKVIYKGFPIPGAISWEDRQKNAAHKLLRLETTIEESSVTGAYERCKVEQV
ncbi:hypothetical protein EHQ53_08625 [Leptospira langatensis]|uniref:Uncharacterized protein n=1 Tax=Leptospira langatensis TaxID=2484983 RepID=A0A5F1ZVE7_9LEPT|nr:hypothetical protein [Leptospira langatensis]TGK01306.1 hypothetical protein EHO57_10245 [Leptospira langatensis]TGL42242.1 hypothetical protein EHQ53_08625 [Leptospira langatensis]